MPFAYRHSTFDLTRYGQSAGNLTDDSSCPPLGEYLTHGAAFVPPAVMSLLLLLAFLGNLIARSLNDTPTSVDLALHEIVQFFQLAHGMALIVSHNVPERYPWCRTAASFTNAAVSSLITGPFVGLIMVVYDVVFRSTWLISDNDIGFVVVLMFMLLISLGGSALNFIAAYDASALTEDEYVGNFEYAAWFSMLLSDLLSYSFYYLLDITYNYMNPAFQIELIDVLANRADVSATRSGSNTSPWDYFNPFQGFQRRRGGGSHAGGSRPALPPLPAVAAPVGSVGSTGTQYYRQANAAGATSVSQYAKK